MALTVIGSSPIIYQQKEYVAEWLKATDCKSVRKLTEVRTLPYSIIIASLANGSWVGS